MKKNQRRPESFIRQPAFPGGKKALDEFVKSNLIYPEEALKNKVEGTVTVLFDIDVFGNVSEVKVKHGIGYGCDEEAMRLVGLLHFNKKKYMGLRVTFHQSINIHFKLHEASKSAPEEQTVKYNITAPGSEKKPVTYTIRIQKQDPGK
ncbi:MAG: energy transducer TonB [Bacteroidia bacterium]|nr:energy transducer TonB [Bacteroidia bacterium]